MKCTDLLLHDKIEAETLAHALTALRKTDGNVIEAASPAGSTSIPIPVTG
jgi:hypothetical protein